MKKLLGFIVFIVIVIGGLFAFYKYDCKTDRKFSVWAQEKVGLYINKDGHFKQDIKYSGSLGDLSLQTDFLFNTDGTGSMIGKTSVSGEIKEEIVEFTYKTDQSLISITHKDESGVEETEYLYFYKDILVYGVDLFGVVIPVCCSQEGVAVSQKSSSKVVGYYFDISVNQGDLVSVINGSDGSESLPSKGVAYIVYENGTTSENPIYLKGDQVIGFDTKEPGYKTVDVKIGDKNYKAVLHVK